MIESKNVENLLNGLTNFINENNLSEDYTIDKGVVLVNYNELDKKIVKYYKKHDYINYVRVLEFCIERNIFIKTAKFRKELNETIEKINKIKEK